MDVNMENIQTSPSSDKTETEVQPQQVNSNNNKLFVIVLISILLSVVVTGSAVYFWQKSVNEKKIAALEQKVAFLEEQISTLKNKNIDLSGSEELTGEIVDVWKTYVDSELNIEFKYPPNLKPLKLSNGVVAFLPEDVYVSCKAAQDSGDIDALELCHKAMFNFSGYKVNPPKSYEEYARDVKEVARLSSFVDSKNRKWDTSLVLGQVYNFDAFTQINNTPVQVSFQYGFDAPSEQEILSFFSQILSSFKFLD